MDCGNGDKNVGCKLMPLVNAVPYCAVPGAELRHRPYAK